MISDYLHGIVLTMLATAVVVYSVVVQEHQTNAVYMIATGFLLSAGTFLGSCIERIVMASRLAAFVSLVLGGVLIWFVLTQGPDLESKAMVVVCGSFLGRWLFAPATPGPRSRYVRLAGMVIALVGALAFAADAGGTTLLAASGVFGLVVWAALVVRTPVWIAALVRRRVVRAVLLASTAVIALAPVVPVAGQGGRLLLLCVGLVVGRWLASTMSGARPSPQEEIRP